MQDSISTTSLRFAFKFPFQSPGWPGRFLIGVGLLFASMMIPVIPAVFVYGYVVEVMRQAINGELAALPEWKDWGQFGKDGLRSLAISLVYQGPGFAVLFIGWAIYMLVYIGGMAMLPGSSPHQFASGAIIPVFLVAMAVLFFSMFAGSLLVIAGAIPLPAALAHFIARDKISAAFHVREWGAILRADAWGFFIGWLVVAGLMVIVYSLYMLLYFSIILCFLAYFVLIPLGFYVLLVSAVIFGQVYRAGRAQLNPALPE